jgi:hypothetical protein
MKTIRECTTEEVCQMLRKVKYATEGMEISTENVTIDDILDEAIRRLEIKPKVPFNDEQFNV